MSKIHSKINSIRLVAFTTIGFGVFMVLIQLFYVISSIASSQRQPDKAVDIVAIQQQNIKKAYDLIVSQTLIKIDNQN